MSEYDVVVIGAGPGGYVSAIRCAQLGLKTAVVEKQWLGGVCLNVGCIPTKALLKNAELAHTLRERSKEFGISYQNLQLDYAEAVNRSRKVSDRLTRGVGFLMKKNNIDVHMGMGRLTAKDKVTVSAADGKVQELKAKNIIVAAGTHCAPFPGMEVDGKHVVTYLEAILQTNLPSSAIIIGAGALGVEFATVWSSYGSEITLVEMLPSIVPTEDEEISAELDKTFKKRGIKTLPGHRVVSARAGGKGAVVTVTGEGGEKTLEAEQALIAIGFKPNLEGLGLEDVGVRLKKSGFVEVNERMATSVPGIWAIGDITGEMLLAHVASAQGMIAAEAIAGRETIKLNYTMIPRATYCQPQVASFGYTEAQAKEKGYNVKVGRMPFQGIGKAIALADYGGFAKVVVDAKYGEILGAHLIGPEVSELLPEMVLAQRLELTIEDVARTVHAHPTLSEVLMEAAHAAEGHAIHI